MELLTLKIKPLSAFATLPKGDTIFGQIVAYDFLDKKDIFKDYLQSEPKLIISDMMPLGYVYKPTLPIECFKSPNEIEVDKKDIRKRKFISIKNLQKGDFHKCEKLDFDLEFSVVRNSINRTTFTTGGDSFAPYAESETSYFKELWMFVLVDSQIKQRVLELIEKIGKYGFGKNASVGKGIFEIEQISNPIENIASNYYMSLSPTILQDEKIIDAWYEPFTRFGKFSTGYENDNVFKKPTLMAQTSAVIKSNFKDLKYFGKSLNNGFDYKTSFLQGYSIALPIIIKDEKWLNIK